MRFKVNGNTKVIKAIRDNDLGTVSFQVEWVVEYMLMPSQEGQQKTEYPPDIQKYRVKHSKLFSDIPQGRPLDKGIEHIIELEEGAKPIMITPYRHPKRLKDEIEKCQD